MPIDFDISCLNCGYNLRGLKPQSRCPECGLNVGDSLARHEIHADPKWLDHTLSGLNHWIGATVLSPVCIGMCFVWGAAEANVVSSFFLAATFALTVFIDSKAVTRLIMDQKLTLLSAGEMKVLKLSSLVASVGLLLLAMAAFYGSAIGIHDLVDNDFDATRGFAVLAFIGYALLTLGVARFIPFHRAVANLAYSMQAVGIARWARVHGLVKVLTDGVLVGSCALALLCGAFQSEYGIYPLFGALFGLMGYGVAWGISLAMAITYRVRVKSLALAMQRPLGFEPVMLPRPVIAIRPEPAAPPQA